MGSNIWKLNAFYIIISQPRIVNQDWHLGNLALKNLVQKKGQFLMKVTKSAVGMHSGCMVHILQLFSDRYFYKDVLFVDALKVGSNTIFWTNSLFIMSKRVLKLSTIFVQANNTRSGAPPCIVKWYPIQNSGQFSYSLSITLYNEVRFN